MIYMDYTIEGKRKIKSTGHEVHPKYWDKKLQQIKDGHVRQDEINRSLVAIRSNIVQPVIDAQLTGTAVKVYKLGNNDFYGFVESWIKEVSGNRAGSTIKNYEKHLRKIKAFAGDDLTFEMIDGEFLTKYEHHVRASHREGKVNSTYITAVWRTLKKWFNVARKRGVTTNYPFDVYENPKDRANEKDYLTLKELDKWTEFVQNSTGKIHEAGMWFLFGCYTGLRVSDWFRFDKTNNIVKNELRLQAKKNKGHISIPIHSRLKEVLKTLPELTLYEQDINEKLKEIAEELKIKKHLTCSCSRKTFAVTMILEMGLNSEIGAHAMGITLSVFSRSYARITNKQVTKALITAWEVL